MDFFEQETKRLNAKYGDQAAFSGEELLERKLEVVPTGILALDYALGIGGWPKGAPSYIWGIPDIGKSSSIGLTGLVQAQKAGMYPGIIATEPNFDAAWAAKHGVDLKRLVISTPDNGEEAFEVLHDWVNSGVMNFILFDSIGGVASESEIEGGKAKVGGNSKLITEGVRKIIMRAWKNNVTTLFLNQVRDDLNAMYAGALSPPGGHAIEHFSPIWIQVKPHRDRYTIKVDSGDKTKNEVLIGRKLVAHIIRNKLSEGTNYKALFEYFQKEVEGFPPIGVNKSFDVTTTGLISGVLRQSGAWYYHDSFPDGKIQSKDKVGEYVASHPEAHEAIRKDVINAMIDKAGVPKAVNPKEFKDESRD